MKASLLVFALMVAVGVIVVGDLIAIVILTLWGAS